MDVAAWLSALGLQRYQQAFSDNDIDADLLPTLTDSDLRELGVHSLGHRRRLLAARDAAATGPPRPSEPSEAPAAAPLGERRQLTVLFCDLVGSTALAAQLDPEDLGEVIRTYQDLCAEIVGRYDGRVFEFLGDGVLVYFGHPRAHEDEAERAVRAGLELVDEVGRIEAPGGVAPQARNDIMPQARNGIMLQARVGIATGLVVVGALAGEGRERGALGETPNLAARLQAAAAPGSVMVDGSTKRLMGRVFEVRDVELQDIKGLPATVHASHVVRRRSAETRSEAVYALMGSTPLIGREQEIELLRHRWAQAKAGEGRVILLSGEPGVGKSRVAASLMARLAEDQPISLRYYCSPYHQDTALFPVKSQLERAARFQRGDMPGRRFDKLRALLAPGTRRGDDAALVADLLAIEGAAGHGLPGSSPQRRKERLFEALLAQLEALAARRPVLALFEDAHWVDPTTLELLEHAVERIRRWPVLLVVTFRPEFQPSWAGLPHVTALALGGLGRAETRALVEQVAGASPLMDAAIAEIVDRTDGVPLFVEELTRAVVEGHWADPAAQDTHAASGLAQTVPAALHAPLMARFDRLGSAKLVVQIGAAIGREFSLELLAAVAGMPEPELLATLDRLVQARLVFRRRAPHGDAFLFKHALVQEAAYGTLLRSTRRELHERIARALEDRFPEVATLQPELLARHCAEAELVDKAVGYWARAGQQAVQRSAMQEAASHLRRALKLLPRLPETTARWQLELELTSALGTALLATKGYTDEERARSYARARELCELLGDAARLVRVMLGQCSYHLARGEVEAVLSIATDLLQRAERQDSREMRVTGHQFFGIGMLYAGRLHEAREHLEASGKLLEEAGEGAASFANGRDALVGVPAYLATLLVLLGDYGQARDQLARCLAIAEQQARPHRLAFALGMAIWFHAMLDEDASALLTRLDALAAERGYPFWRGFVRMCQGHALARAGEAERGIAVAREGVAEYDAAGAAWATPILFCTIASVVDSDHGLALVDDAFARIEGTGVHFFEPELHRVKGEMLLRSDHACEAETHLAEALRLAHRQGARHWELRSAASLARLRQSQGRCAEAYDEFAAVLRTFGSSVDTPDLARSKALLDQLAADADRPVGQLDEVL